VGAGASLGAELADCGVGTGSGVGWTGAVSGGGAGSGVGADTFWAAAVGVAHAAAERKAITSSFKVSPGGLGVVSFGAMSNVCGVRPEVNCAIYVRARGRRA
jgi:hypothetical protein